jgi:hypothetical protein
MHGDEATATMALFDMFRFLADEQNPLRNYLHQHLTLYFVPMLNPDGAQVFKRRNALDIDMNRDALRLASSESRLLKHLRDSLQPHFGFNLHDQRIHYTAGNSPLPATISFLAPAFNDAKDINPVRLRAMQLIAAMNDDLSFLIPGQVARYNDAFEPRAFGDNIQKWGTSVVLIESGGYKNDPEKQQIRKLNYIAILAALQNISIGHYQHYTTEQYQAIPENETRLRPLILRNLSVKSDSGNYIADVSYDYREVTYPQGSYDFYYRSHIEDIGDLSNLYGYSDIDCSDLRVEYGKIYPRKFPDLEAVSVTEVAELLREGYTSVVVSESDSLSRRSPLAVNILAGKTRPARALRIDSNPDLVLRNASGKVVFAIINGFLHSPDSARHTGHGMVYQ